MALLAKRVYIGLVFSLLANSASGAEMKPDAINSAEPSKKALSSEKPTPAGVRCQVLLDRAHFSPGEIDGKFGENAKKALRAYAEFQQLPSSDTVTGEVWKKLVADDRPVLADYSLTEKDVSGPFESHGCVRLTKWDAERVADRVGKGTRVAFVDGPR